MHLVTAVQQLGLNEKGEKPEFESNSMISNTFSWVATSEYIDCPFKQNYDLTIEHVCISGLSRYSSFFRNI